jgi:hypothetical protein
LNAQGAGGDANAVCVRMSDRDYDRADAKARRERVSVPDVVRRALRKLLEEEA